MTKEENLKGCLEWTFPLIKFAGYWFPRSGNKISTIKYSVYSVLVLSCTIITLAFTEIVYVVLTFGQLEMIDTLYILLTHLGQCSKILTFMLHKKKIYKLLDYMEESIFKPKNAEQYKKAIKITRFTNLLAKILVGLVVVCCAFLCLAALLEKQETRHLPVKAWFPFNTENSPQHEIVTAYQLIAIVACGCANAAMDMIAAAFISYISVQLEILNDSLIHIKDFAEQKLLQKSPFHLTEFKKQQFPISKELESEMKFLLVEVVKHHIKIKK